MYMLLNYIMQQQFCNISTSTIYGLGMWHAHTLMNKPDISQSHTKVARNLLISTSVFVIPLNNNTIHKILIRNNVIEITAPVIFILT